MDDDTLTDQPELDINYDAAMADVAASACALARDVTVRAVDALLVSLEDRCRHGGELRLGDVQTLRTAVAALATV